MEKLWCSFMPSLYHYVWDRDGAIDNAACHWQLAAVRWRNRLHLATAQPKADVWRWDDKVAETAEWAHAAWLSAAFTCAKQMLSFTTHELLSLATAVLYFSYTSVRLPPFLRSDIKSKNHFTELERGRGSLMDEQLRACREGAWNDWWW